MLFFRRLKYIFLVHAIDRPDALARRVAVESELLNHVKHGTAPSTADCKRMAYKLGTPTWALKDKNL